MASLALRRATAASGSRCTPRQVRLSTDRSIPAVHGLEDQKVRSRSGKVNIYKRGERSEWIVRRAPGSAEEFLEKIVQVPRLRMRINVPEDVGGDPVFRSQWKDLLQLVRPHGIIYMLDGSRDDSAPAPELANCSGTCCHFTVPDPVCRLRCTSFSVLLVLSEVFRGEFADALSKPSLPANSSSTGN